MRTIWKCCIPPMLQSLIFVACPRSPHTLQEAEQDLRLLDSRPNPVYGVPNNEPKLQHDQKATGTDVNVSNLSGDESEVSIDVNPVDPSNQVVVGHASSFAVMNTFHSTDNRQSWTLVPLGDSQDGLTSTFRFDPAVTFDDGGNVYALYGARLAVPDGSTETSVVLARSTDGGATYSHFVRPSTAPDIVVGMDTLPGNDRWFVAAGPHPGDPSQQNVYVTMTANIDVSDGRNQPIIVVPSHDAGQSVLTSIYVNDESIPPSRDLGTSAPTRALVRTASFTSRGFIRPPTRSSSTCRQMVV